MVKSYTNLEITHLTMISPERKMFYVKLATKKVLLIFEVAVLVFEKKGTKRMY